VKNDRLLDGADILESIQTLMKSATTMKSLDFRGFSGAKRISNR